MSPSKVKISFCTICRDDIDLLKQTLLFNIKHNEDYNNHEFIIMDCNPTAQLEVWINKSCSAYATTGKLIYHKIKEPDYFNFSSAKNTLLRSATGDILCLIHPGHYTATGFADYINEAFYLKHNRVLITEPETFHEPTFDHPPGQIIGKLCVTKTNFTAVNGYDERMIKFGNEDVDLVNRLQNHGLEKNTITNTDYCKGIKQSAVRGFLLCKSTSIDSIFICPLTPATSEIIFLYKDRSFEKGTLTDQAALFSDNYKYLFQQRRNQYKYLLKGIERRGSWKNHINEHCIRFQYSPQDVFELRSATKGRYDRLIHVTTGKVFHLVNDPWMIEQLLLLNNILYNTRVMEENAACKRVRVNMENVTIPQSGLDLKMPH